QLSSKKLNLHVNLQLRLRYISSVAEFTPKTVQTDEIRTTLVYEVRVYVNDPNDQLKMGQYFLVIMRAKVEHALNQH
ncbi:hypothetical protein OPU39_18680, partial [Acinetobacter nosocomialis]|nr:hypothetical protein [Acinetobacter nosocomialis]